MAGCGTEDAQRFHVAMGWKMWRASIAIYFSSLREAAISAVDPASRAAPSIYDSANGHVTVTSQHSDLTTFNKPCDLELVHRVQSATGRNVNVPKSKKTPIKNLYPGRNPDQRQNRMFFPHPISRIPQRFIRIWRKLL